MIRQEQVKLLSAVSVNTLSDLKTSAGSPEHVPIPASVDTPEVTATKVERELTNLESIITEQLTNTDGLQIFASLLQNTGGDELT